MARGAFVVSPKSDNPRDILFQTKTDVEASDEQLSLKAEVEQALVVLQMLFPDNEKDKRYGDYFEPLLSLAQCGLVGDHARPEVARRALMELKNEVVAREGGRIKNRYIKKLGVAALVMGGCACGMSGAATLLAGNNLFSQFCLLWSGCMAGVWLSFGARKTHLKFEELSIPEADRLEPSVRLIFAGLLTVLFGIIFAKEVVLVSVGSVASSQITSDPLVAILVGAFCGISELALSLKFTEQASKFLTFK